MKKIISVLLSSAIMIGSVPVLHFSADAAGKSQYEFEKGIILNSGENGAEITAVSGASAGKAVDLKDGGNTVSVTVNAENTGAHRLSIRYNQPYDEGGKYQNIIVNGKNAGEIFCEYTGDDFGVVSVNAELKKGSNEIAVEASWGWTNLDCLLIEEGSFSNYTGTAKLSNPKSTAKTQALYNYLCDTYGKNVISGQQESTWMGSENYEFDIIKNASGKYPAIRGLDYMGDDFSGCNRRAKQWYEMGGIVTICWHCGSDFRGSHTESLDSDLNWSSALTPGTNEYNALIAGMDKGAKALLELKEAGIPVIWRPFHEFDGKWFWWGKGGAENFKKLWRIMYDRYTNYWGLDNLIWNLGYCGDVNSGWYPGDEYVDIIGADTYVNHTESLVSMYNKTAQVANKPVCLHENGPIPDPEKMKADGAKWLWFMTWHTSFIDSNQFNTASYINRIYNSDYMITLDELPDVYSYGNTSSGEDNSPEFPEALMGDLNKDGEVNAADAVILQKWLLGKGGLDADNWKNADLQTDGVINAFDMIRMRKLLVNTTSAPDITVPDQSTYKYDAAKQYAEYPSNYKNSISQSGTVVKESYNGINGMNSLNVYLPYGYDQNKKYNIFYFMHGMGDNENSLLYNDNGEMQRVFDNMIKNGDIEPMIIVTPTFNKCSNDTFYNAENFYKEFRESVVPFVEGKYSTYAASNSMEDIKASRMHRAYGGFSMGSVSTWAVFENCVDIVGYFLPMSGAHHWGTGNADAGALARAVDKAGLKKNEYFIMSATGTSDFAYSVLASQIEAMKKQSQFEYTSDFSKGNFWFILANGGEHSWYYVRQYIYNCLPFFFRQ
ncbi:MAG: hypothetical protein J6A30_04245 [Ruminococcus sp.]|nr:hypothetical protein [Ruminococcus sp.]